LYVLTETRNDYGKFFVSIDGDKQLVDLGHDARRGVIVELATDLADIKHSVELEVSGNSKYVLIDAFLTSAAHDIEQVPDSENMGVLRTGIETLLPSKLSIARFEKMIEKYNLELLAADGSSIQIYGLENVSKIQHLKMFKPTASNFKTDIFAIDSVIIDNATLVLPKSGSVELIYKCDDFDYVNYVCSSGWYDANITFEQNDTHVWFIVYGFSAYGGGSDGFFTNDETSGPSLDFDKQVPADITRSMFS